ncbi:hypothetical protein BDW_05985 [Bdellovibrio bacteriovorus W]|nr:hypothetical protein BDW_05985 [Bdellovibrio bacteriovorus W]
MNKQIYVTFPSLKKRGLVTMFLLAWDGPALLFILALYSGVHAILSAIDMKSASPLGGLIPAAIFAGMSSSRWSPFFAIQ